MKFIALLSIAFVQCNAYRPECNSIVKNEIYNATKACFLRTDNFPTDLDISGSGVPVAKTFCTQDCADKQLAAQAALKQANCQDEVIVQFYKGNVTLLDAMKSLEAKFVWVCTPTANSQSYCVDQQLALIGQNTIEKLISGTLISDFVCTDCHQRQLDRVGAIPELPKVYQDFVNKGKEVFDGGCKDRQLKVIEGKGNGVSATFVSGANSYYIAFALFIPFLAL